MYSTNEIKKVNKRYEEEVQILNSFCNEVRKMNDNIDLEEVKNTLNYAEAKELYKLILSCNSNSDRCEELKTIVKDKKIKEYPQILDVHYYPVIKEIDFLTDDKTILLDKIIKGAYKNARKSRELSKMDFKVLKFLIDKEMIEKIYVFRCNCGSDECYDKEITQKHFDKLKDYWEKELKDETTHEEDAQMNYGCFSTGCWNDGDVEVSCLEDFNEHMRFVKYKVIKEPDMTLDKI